MSKPKIIVTGANGRLGAALVREWKKMGEDVRGFGKEEINLAESRESLGAKLAPVDFDVLVNCAAQTNVDRCETQAEEAFQINGKGPSDLADICRGKDARCIHISTDYVYDGAKSGPYTEDDAATPISIYGASKLAGDDGVLKMTEGKGLVVRVSWVFGPDRPSFVDQIVKRAQTEETVAAISDKIAVPTYTLDVASLLRPLLYENLATGIIHLCNSGACSWQEYGQFALDFLRSRGVSLKSDRVGAQRMADLKAFIARRPPNTVMSTEKFAKLTGERPRSWQDAVSAYLETQIPLL